MLDTQKILLEYAFNIKKRASRYLDIESVLNIENIDMNNICYVCSIKVIDEKKKLEGMVRKKDVESVDITNYFKQGVSSSFLFLDCLLLKNVNYFLQESQNMYNFIIFNVRLENKDINTIEYALDDSLKLVIVEISYDEFFKAFKNFDFFIKKYLSKYNIDDSNYRIIYIFYGLLWSSIVYLFEISGFKLNGGTKNRRHILSVVEKELMEFMVYSQINLCISNKMMQSVFSHDILSSPRFDSVFKKFTKNSYQSLDSFKHVNDDILYFLEKQKMSLKEIEKKYHDEEIISLKRDIDNINWDINELENENKDLIHKIEDNRKLEFKLDSKINTPGYFFKEKTLNEKKDSLVSVRKKIEELGKNIEKNKLTISEKRFDIDIIKKKIPGKEKLSNDIGLKVDKISKNISGYVNNKKVKFSVSIDNNNISKRSYSTAAFGSSLKSVNSKDMVKDSINNINNIMERNVFLQNALKGSDFKEINDILHMDADLKSKQLKIEDYVSKFILNKLDIEIGRGDILNNSGLNLISNFINSFKSDYEDYVNKKDRVLESKSYKWFIKNTSADISISYTITCVMSYLVKEDHNIVDSNHTLTKLYKKVGKGIVDQFILNLYKDYLSFFKKSFNSLNPDINIDLYSDGYLFKDDNIQFENFKEDPFIFNDKFLRKNIVFEDNLSFDSFKNIIDQYLEDNLFGLKLSLLNDFELESFYANIGVSLITLFGSKGMLYEVVSDRVSHNKTYTKIVASDIFNEFMNKFSIKDISRIPMVCPPLDWNLKNSWNDTQNNNVYGGYLTNLVKKESLIHRNNKNVGKVKLLDNDLIKTVNFIQKQALNINIVMLNYVLSLIENDVKLEDPFIFKLHDKTDLIHSREKISNALRVEILRNNSLAKRNLITLSTALLFKDIVFYCPIFVDWRGRIYTLNSVLSYQGDELTKSLLYFSDEDAAVLNGDGVRALKIYIANCYGLDKKSYKERLKWANDHFNEIISLDQKLIDNAKDKFLFVAAIFELKQYHDNPATFKSRLPIFIDATCNGLQHLSSIVGDLNLATLVNLTKSSISDRPNDIYQTIANKIKDDVERYNKDIAFNQLKKLNINRDLIKRCIMTIPYGVTIYGMQKQLIEDFFLELSLLEAGIASNCLKCKSVYKLRNSNFLLGDFNVKNTIFTGKEIYTLAKLVHTTLYNTYPSLNELIEYLKNMNSVFKELKMGNF